MMGQQLTGTGMYIIDQAYHVLNYNKVLKEMYPELSAGDLCYRTLARLDSPCPACPLHGDHVTPIYNQVRKEWISANAAEMEYPGHGTCYNIQFRRQKRTNGVRAELIQPDALDNHITELLSVTGKEAVIGAYYEPGSPIFYGNIQMALMLGYDTVEEMIESMDGLVVNTVHPEDRARVRKDMENVRHEGDTYETTYRMPRKDGTWFWAVTKGKMIRADSGHLATFSVCSDMTDLMKRQEALVQENASLTTNRQELEALMHLIPGGYHRCGTQGGFTLEFVSNSFLEIVGWTREELARELDNQYIQVVAPEDRERFMSYEPELASTGRIHVAYRILRKDGTRRWVQDATMRVEMDGQEYYQCTLADITDFVEQQQKLSEWNMKLTQEKSLMDIIAKNMPSGYHRCKAVDGVPFLYIGKYFLDIVGYTKEEIETVFDNKFHNLVWPEDLPLMYTQEDMVNMRGKGNTYETTIYRIRHKDGGFRWVTDSTMFVDLGEDSFFQGTISDITEYVESLEEARHIAEASSQAKSTFLFNASHDIRTPMNAIQGFSYIIEENADNPVIVKENIRKIHESGEILMTLLNDVLELARIEKGKDEVYQQPISMVEYGGKLYEMFAGEMEQAGLIFRMENQIVHDRVLGDSLKLTRIAMNLLSNAKKFTPRGGMVTFGIREENFSGRTAEYCLYVRDTGIGMSREFQKRAFDQFERERTSTDSGVSGSGLGLAIIKRLADLMGGRCSICSELGKGSEITVTVPLALDLHRDVSQQDVASKVTDLTGKRILLVEDNDFNREIARYILEGMGLSVEEAANGSACVDKVLRSEPGTFDMVLMDIQMPVMDGYLATAEIRRISDPAKANLPIVAMTANAFEEDRKRCLEAGMNGHIGKPIDPQVLKQVLVQIL